MAAQTYHGSCACGNVRFEARLNLTEGTFKCNCSICTKARSWGAAVPAANVQLLSGENELSTYAPRQIRHRFCRTCGIKLFGQGESPDMGGAFTVINLGTLDDLDPREWAKAPVQYTDGRHDDWAHSPEFTAHL